MYNLNFVLCLAYFPVLCVIHNSPRFCEILMPNFTRDILIGCALIWMCATCLVPCRMSSHCMLLDLIPPKSQRQHHKQTDSHAQPRQWHKESEKNTKKKEPPKEQMGPPCWKFAPFLRLECDQEGAFYNSKTKSNVLFNPHFHSLHLIQ